MATTQRRSRLISRLLITLLRGLSTLRVAVKRLLAQPGLMLATLLGLVTVAATVMSIPMYAEGVYYRVLSEGLFSDAPGFRGTVVRPPVAVLYRYVGAFTGPLQWEHVAPLDSFFSDAVYEYLELPPSPQSADVHLFNTGLFGLYPERDADRVTDIAPTIEVGLAAFTGPERHVNVLSGSLTAGPTSTGSIDVMVSRAIAERVGVQEGEVLIAYDRRAQRRYEASPAKFQLRVVGVWEPGNPGNEFWDYVQIPPDNTLIVSHDAFVNQVSPALADEIYQALWYLPMDASKVYASDVSGLLTRLKTLDGAVQVILPSTTVDVSPLKALERYQSSTNVLSIQLLVLSVPVVALMLTFVVLMVTLTTDRQRNQTAVLRSRGATKGQVAGIVAAESLVLGVVGFGLAVPISLAVATLMGQTRSFLDFSLRTDFRVGITWPTLAVGALAMGVTLAAQILPTLEAARHTMVTYKQERARALRPPWWQRAYLDVMLLVPGGYGAYLLNQQGNLLGVQDVTKADPFSNPLLILVPAFTLFSLTLVLLRLLPIGLRFLAWVSRRTRSVSLLMAARQLSRAPGLYTAPVGLLILTLALSTYTASLAATLDNHLFDQQNYRVGADVSLVDTGEELGASDVSLGGTGGGEASQWQFLPVTDYLAIPGTEGAARVGSYEMRVQTPAGYLPGRYIGVDRVDFGAVAFWRGDFADGALGALMNSLATRNDGVLVPASFLQEQVLMVGDTINFSVQAYGRSASARGQVVGTFEYFPTWYPDSGPLIVGNLDHFFLQAQTQLPYRVWLETADGTDYADLGEAVREMNLGAKGMMVAARSITEEQRRPEHQGLMGLLSVGFTAAAVLSAMGFLLYGLSSFRRRSVELGVLRATGLGARHVSGIIGFELALMLLVGALAGTGLGVWASRAFVPDIQFGIGATANVPPYDVAIAWSALTRLYGLFAVLFVVALAALVRRIVRLKLFQAIKLGETI